MMNQNELLPTSELVETFHRITVKSKVFKALEDIRRQHRLWDREAAIIWLLQQQGLWIEEKEREYNNDDEKSIEA